MFVPLYDETALRHIPRPYGVYALLAANVAVFLLTRLDAAGLTERFDLSFGVIPAVIFGEARLSPEFVVVPTFATPFTSLFLHGDVWHLLGNMLFLWVFGDNVEDAMGHVRFVVFYVLCGVVAALAHAVAFPDSRSALIGASGAVSGVLVAYLMLHPHVRVFGLAFKWVPLTIKALYALVAWIVLQFASALLGGDPAVGWWAHVGGVLAGAALILVFKKPEVLLFDRREK